MREQQTSQTTLAIRTGDNDIFDFPLGNRSRHDKAKERVCLLEHERDSWRRFCVEQRFVLSLGPMCGGGSLRLKRQNGGYILQCDGANVKIRIQSFKVSKFQGFTLRNSDSEVATRRAESR